MGANDWDLEAVVRGCFAVPRATREAADDPFSSHPPASIKEEHMDGNEAFTCFPDLMVRRSTIHELEELLKPFLPEFQQQQSPLLPSQKTSPISNIAVVDLPAHQIRQTGQQQRPLSQTPRSKRRKNQQKRVVCQVPANGPSPDMWAWRKYGQKPIKGSPYPRGYYRCSSSKGCLARKQVEQSRTDPGMLVVTYTAEHNHSVPTHRNSLAGSTRHKYQPAPSNATIDQTQVSFHSGEQLLHANNPSSSPMSSSAVGELSPRTPLTTSMEDEVEDEDELLVGDEMVFEDELLLTTGRSITGADAYQGH